MSNFTLSIFGNKIFLEILNEIKLFSKYKTIYYQDLQLCVKESEKLNQLGIFFIDSSNKDSFNKNKNFPSIVVSTPKILKKISFDDLTDKLSLPFSILDLEKKIISLISKNEFKKNSLISLKDYIIDKNERKIKKNNLELQLSEKEINFLILFSTNNKPISKNSVLKNVWNYSDKTETHTVETHIHRLRKKIFQTFGDNNFIKNNNKGYYI